LLKIVRDIFIKMKSLGETLRALRENRQLPLRTVAAYLDIDPESRVAEEKVKYQINKQFV
jgi:cytoskeletal protein RodZ